VRREEIEHLKLLLTEQLHELIRDGEETVSGVRSQPHAFSDPLDRASHDEVQDSLFRIRERESRLIKKIRNALECIEDGTYGICEQCGEEISYKRLEARPVTTKCIECKIKEENMERAAH
jgi:DnaK suppressor protein